MPVIRSLIVLLPSLVMAGCSLTPLYGDSLRKKNVVIALTPNNDDHHLFLAGQLDRQLNIHPDAPYRLDISLRERSQSLFIQPNTSARGSELIISADVVLRQGTRIVIKRQLHESATYRIGSTSYADSHAKQRLREHLLTILASRITMQLLHTIDPI